MYNTPKLLKVLNNEKVSIPPIWLMRQAGRYLPEYWEVRNKAGGFLELCYQPELAATVTLQPINRFNFDAAIIFSDILVIPHALGVKLEFLAGEGPHLEKIPDEISIEQLNLSAISEKLQPVYEAIRITRRELSSEKALIGFSGAPWTIATYLIEKNSKKDFQDTKKFAFSQPELFQKLIDILVSAISTHLINQIEAGVQAIQIFDSWAGVLNEQQFSQWVVNPTKKIIENVKSKYPLIPIIGFPKGAAFNYKNYVDSLNLNAIGLDCLLPFDFIEKNIKHKKVLQGNLDPIILLSNKDVIRRNVIEIMYNFNDSPFIFNLGHGILPSTPIDNVHFLIDTVIGYKK